MRRLLLIFILAAVASCSQDGPSDTAKETAPGTVVRESISSQYLGRSINYTVWLPAGYDASQKYPFLYLLHGAGDDDQSWNSKGGANKLADIYIRDGGLPMVIVMPDALLTFYLDNLMDNGLYYEQYMHKELMPEVESKYGCNGKRAVAGLSMGGYGTLYNVLKYPGKFLYGYAMSPATDTDGSIALIKQQASTDVFPPITIESGLGDIVIPIDDVRKYVQAIKSNGVDCTFIERSGGHDWKFWPVCLEKALVKISETF